MASQVKTSLLTASGQLTSALTLLRGLVIYNMRATQSLFSVSEVSTVPGGASFPGLATPTTETVPIEFDPPLRFESGVSLSIPTSVAVGFIYEMGR